MTDDTHPLSRWSQRKLAARRGELDDEGAAASPVATPDEPSVAGAAEGGAEAEALRRAALRKLWTSDPVLANLDGLNNYDEDYNVVDQVITLAQTSYRPGIGYFDEIEKKIEEAGDRLERIDEALRDGDERPAQNDARSAVLSNNDAPADNPSNALQESEPGSAGDAASEPSGDTGKSA